MSLNWRLDKENVVHLHNGVYSAVNKQCHHEICKQMGETKKKKKKTQRRFSLVMVSVHSSKTIK